MKLITYTSPNPRLDQVGESVDAGQMLAGHGTVAENLAEYAARLCYHSTARMGSNPTFVQARIREGHEDVIEHAHFTVMGQGQPEDDPESMFAVSPHLRLSRLGDHYMMTGNARVWLQLFRSGLAMDCLPIVFPLAPQFYAEFEEIFRNFVSRSMDRRSAEHVFMDTVERDAQNADRVFPPSDNGIPFWKPATHLWQVGPARVLLLGASLVPQGVTTDIDVGLKHGSAVFLLEGVSRSLTHQLVRHRMASFSQESQRYVNLDKGGWGYVTPPALMENGGAQILNGFWETVTDTYRRLRELGARNEDARFVLPNATETRIVVSMPLFWWRHFVWLRALDKAAQWEIRGVGLAILQSLYHLAPHLFAREYEFMKSNNLGIDKLP